MQSHAIITFFLPHVTHSLYCYWRVINWNWKTNFQFSQPPLQSSSQQNLARSRVNLPYKTISMLYLRWTLNILYSLNPRYGLREVTRWACSRMHGPPRQGRRPQQLSFQRLLADSEQKNRVTRWLLPSTKRCREHARFLFSHILPLAAATMKHSWFEYYLSD